MSYFDHVKCHHCGAMLDPDKLSAGMTCTRCGGELSLQDLFGVKDAFVGHDDGGGNDLGLDDLLAPGRNNPYAEDPLKQHRANDGGMGGGHAPRSQAPARGPATPARSPGSNRPALPMGGSSASGQGGHRHTNDANGRGMVHVPKQGDDWDDGEEDDIDGSSSALELMRKMKKRR